MREYYSIPLEDEEAQALLDISLLTEQPVKAIPFPGDINTAIENYELGSSETYWYENQHIIGLYFKSSELEVLPESIGNMSYLRFLSIEVCKFQTLPLSFKNLHNLEVLIFNNHPSGYVKCLNLDFPDIFQDLKSLKKLYIDGPYNIYIPLSFLELENLQELHLDCCFFSPNKSKFLLNSNIKDNEEFFRSTNLIFELPNEIEKLKSLNKLELNHLEIESLPKSLINVNSLTELNLCRSNNIKNIEIVFHIKSLVKLDLSFCGIKSIPNAIGNLINLKELNISHNRILELPLEIKNCQKLEKLYLFSNRLEKELTFLLSLPNLKQIIYTKVYSKSIPKKLFEIKGIDIKGV